MTITLPPLPYPQDSLEPFISSETISYHYDKHHRGYVNKLNTLITDTEFEGLNLTAIIKKSDGAIFNNAAQIWNHSFYWYCLSPKKNTNPSRAMANEIIKHFGSEDDFKSTFINTALNTFGSGWVWLVKNSDNSLSIISTSNAGTPLSAGQTPLLTCDVWEHAYYIDVRNDRGKYLENFWRLINWQFVEKSLHGEYEKPEADALLQ